MADLPCSSGVKRKLAAGVLAADSSSKSSKVTLLNQSLLLLEIPADTNTSFPVWEALRSRQVDIAWTMNPYSISVRLTPVTSEQGKTMTSSKSESTSSLTQSSALNSSIQYVPQTHCVLFAFSQNIQLLPYLQIQHENIHTNPVPATSLIAFPPLIVTQPQPSTPTKSGVPSTVLTPASSPAPLQSLSKEPVPLPFHTKISPDIQICDRFLLGSCRAGKRCKMHHTRYPFHWQLWNVVTHQWVDISPRSQVLLERIYCNVNIEHITLKEGCVSCCLNFDVMEVDGLYKYDGVRRLTNSDSPAKNPYFPSKWKIYWWDNSSWEEYNMNVSTLLLKAMSEKEPECYFYIDSVQYKVDFTLMLQINVNTGYQRGVRYRPVYHSLDSMQPYLKTGVQSESPQTIGDPPAVNFSVDPLENFSTWYPPVWCQASEGDYSLVDVPAGSRAYQRIQELFYESMSGTAMDVFSIQQVQNLLHWDKYQRQKMYMLKQHGSEEPLERHLFHGTTREASEDICYNNFDPRLAGVNGIAYGYGSYFATSALLSSRYSVKKDVDAVRHMFLAKVLVGKVTLGRGSYRRPPPYSSKTRQHQLYDACVDNKENPTMFVVFDSCQCYPYYLIKYKDPPTEIEI